MDKCQYKPPYNAEEILAASSVYPMPDALTVSAGGRITCGFDDEREYCSWHNALDADLRRVFIWDLKHSNDKHPYVLVAVDSRRPTPAVVKSSKKNAITGPNPLNFTIPHSVDPITVRIEILNINSQDILLIDNLYYEGRICELIEENETTGVTDETLVTISPISIEPQLLIHKISRDASIDPIDVQTIIDVPEGQEAVTNQREKGDNEQIVHDLENTRPSNLNQLLQLNTEAFGKAADFVACEALACDFNHNHSCFYNLNGFGSTSPWLIGTAFVGNRHTGIQRLNQEDSKRVGFAYVGKDHVDESNEIFVMESPKFTLSTNATLVFDVYLRSHSPRLKACIDSFDDCPYESPRVSAHEFWLLDNSVELPRGVRKVFKNS
ncbi:hypothetical protein RB195_013018 [Necator americanus]|uniref:MAM domain-containing protein n=1 Tax=Necator americanus TaxID=51031 RepID=A0ABR1DTM1_NECAM